ncbi:hypothetical protein B0O99DRAFT_683166 [Bisporella sp. PMI_857]|nr:hypothetical protein B0O99DRAFT_683166 [Bisporella sp. PMI_857]
MTRKMIISERNLGFICIESAGRLEHSNQPSWAPDWLNFWTQPKTILDTYDPGRVLCARPLKSPTKDGRVLVVQGCTFDEIYSLSSAIKTDIPTTVSSRFPELSDHSDPKFQRWAAAINSNYPNEIQDALWSSLCLLLPIEGIESTSHLDCMDPYCYGSKKRLLRQYFENIWIRETSVNLRGTSLLEWLRENEALQVGDYTLKDWFTLSPGFPGTQISVDDMTVRNNTSETNTHEEGGTSSQAGAIRYRNLVTAITRVIESSMRLMITKKGMIGMAHPAAQVGDQIGILQGCCRSVILRKQEARSNDLRTGYRIIGTAMTVSEKTQEEIYRYALQEFETGDLILY